LVELALAERKLETRARSRCRSSLLASISVMRRASGASAGSRDSELAGVACQLRRFGAPGSLQPFRMPLTFCSRAEDALGAGPALGASWCMATGGLEGTSLERVQAYAW
jgi:hypothetical protein